MNFALLHLQKRIELKSDGSALRDFIHYTDIFNAIKLLINYQISKMDNTFNLSFGNTVSISNVLEKLSQFIRLDMV